MYTPHLIYPLVYQWTFRFFPCLAIVSNAAMNTGIQISLDNLFSFPLNIYSDIYFEYILRWLDHLVVLFLNL